MKSFRTRVPASAMVGVALVAGWYFLKEAGIRISGDTEDQTVSASRGDSQIYGKNWMLDKWTEDDTTYYKIRQDINKVSLDDILNTANNYNNRLERNQDDINSLFGWAYAAYKAKSHYVSHSYNSWAKSVSAIQRRETRNSYEWARLRFLTTNPGAPNADYKQLALRLIKHNPDDDEIKYFLLDTVNLREPNDRKLAIQYLEELFRSHPESSSNYTAAGSLYLGLWGIENKPEYAQKSAAAYREFLRRAPADHPFRSRAESLIKVIEKSKSSQNDGGGKQNDKSG